MLLNKNKQNQEINRSIVKERKQDYDNTNTMVEEQR